MTLQEHVGGNQKQAFVYSLLDSDALLNIISAYYEL